MTMKFAPVQTPVKEMTAGEVRQWLDGLADSEVMRSILIAEINAIRAGEQRNPRTMRHLWYEVVKPVLSRAGILNNATAGGKPIPWDKKLSKYLAELVRAGYTSYEELRIIDGSRQRQPAREVTTGVIDVQLVGAHFPWVILFTEKDTIWNEVQGLADLYGVSAISGGGEPSYACTENTVRAIVRSAASKREKPVALILLSLTDYDPFGYHIANAQHEQFLDAARNLPAGELGSLKAVRHFRIGLTPDQLTPGERAANAYEPKEQSLDSWFEETGGVDGQPLGIELDALDLEDLRRLFADGIEQAIDLEKRKQDLRDAFLDLMACELLVPDFERRRRVMREAILSGELWQDIADAHIPDDLFRRAAIDGADWIAPSQTMELFSDYSKSVKQAMREADSRE